MIKVVTDDDASGRTVDSSMQHTLDACEDFRREVTALEELVLQRGNILVMSPKGHCELAGEGIEYDWGRQVTRATCARDLRT